jgi:hypothetical protein
MEIKGPVGRASTPKHIPSPGGSTKRVNLTFYITEIYNGMDYENEHKLVK